MPIFAVIATKNAQRVRERIESLASSSESLITGHYELKSDTWFLAYRGATRQLAEDLGIRKGETGPGVVLSVENYSGRAGGDLWEYKVNSVE
jgi:hypothetical protein